MNRVSHPLTRRIAPLVAVALCAAVLVGCGGRGQFTFESIDAANLLAASYDRVIYSADGTDHVNVLLISGEDVLPDQVVHIRMFWRPKAGKTPMDASATNAVVKCIILQGEQAAVYGGGGFVMPRLSFTDERFAGDLRQATLRLLEATDQFADGTGGQPAVAGGTFTAERNDAEVQQTLRRVDQTLAQRLGKG